MYQDCPDASVFPHTPLCWKREGCILREGAGSARQHRRRKISSFKTLPTTQFTLLQGARRCNLLDALANINISENVLRALHIRIQLDMQQAALECSASSCRPLSAVNEPACTLVDKINQSSIPLFSWLTVAT